MTQQRKIKGNRGRDRVEKKHSRRSPSLNTVEQNCNICLFQLQETFIKSIWLLSYFTPKVSKSIHSEGTRMVFRHLWFLISLLTVGFSSILKTPIDKLWINQHICCWAPHLSLSYQSNYNTPLENQSSQCHCPFKWSNNKSTIFAQIRLFFSQPHQNLLLISLGTMCLYLHN